jgi:peptidoglycan/xylan/chitin deacetylase (PgdA/CDA1 family)
MRSIKLTALYLFRALGLFKLAAWWTRDTLKILCYHGFALADEAVFRPKLFITTKVFETRLEILRHYGIRVLKLDDAIERLYAGNLPAASAVITIDDGFHSVRALAAPVLDRYNFPATVYVTTYYVEKGVPIFRLVLQYMFWKTACRRLVLKDVPWSLDTEIDLTDAVGREQALWACINYCEANCTENERGVISERMGTLLDVPYRDILESRILHLMTVDELRELGNLGLDIALHTHRHTFPSDDETRARRELADNSDALARVLGRGGFHHFCYPSGYWDPCQWAWLEAEGVRSSTTCLSGLNTRATPRHALSRFLDGENIHAIEFEAALCGFSDLLRTWLRRDT